MKPGPLSLLAPVLLAAVLPAQAATPDLELIMSDPDWIGNAPETAHWADDGTGIYYRQKRTGETIRDHHYLNLTASAPQTITPAQANRNSGPNAVYSAGYQYAAWASEGDIYLKQLPSGEVTRVTATATAETQPVFNATANALLYQSDGQFFRYELSSGRTRQLSNLQFTADPEDTPAFDALRQQQLRSYSTVAEDRRRRLSQAAQNDQWQRDDETAAALPLYLGDEYELVSQQLSPNERHLALVVKPANYDAGREGKMPNYVTADGYVAVKTVRTRVNRNTRPPQSLLIVDLHSAEVTSIPFDTLPGIDKDPLRKLRKQAIEWHVAAGAERTATEAAIAAPELRTVTVEQLQWNRSGSQLAAQLIANDYKDRWLVTVAAGANKAEVQERLSDDAWISWKHNEFGWLADDKTLWFLSEASGYSHLYTKALDERRPRQLTRGEFVVREPAFDRDNRFAYVVSNRNHPGNWQVYRLPVAGGELQQISKLDGVSNFRLSPRGDQLLLSHSQRDRHADLYLAPADGSAPVRQLTDSVSEPFKAIPWVVPEIVEVPSSHVARPIYSKLYLPPDYQPGGNYPAVMFVHGAGYTQNAHLGWPYYFREFMFHTVLANAGYVVLDMDYRASEGYGRDWRTSIYRNMGHPELEDYLDGIDYLAEQWQVDRERVGIYGGSYGGFMTFMALFRAPQAFAAGAALRPVVDWMHYNDEYTARILNTPEVDPEAYQRSSPINHAAGLERPLLIAAGMQDDNVFFQDSVLMVQKLIELKKEDFEIAIYPLDGHGFIHAESWLDEYRRIFKLMEQNLKEKHHD